MTRIEFQNVFKAFGGGGTRIQAVDGVSFAAAGGEVLGVLGPNGAGKTTIIRMLLDVFRPDAGEILVEGERDGNRRDEFRRRVAYLPEERGLYQKRKIKDVIEYTGALRGLSRAETRERAAPLLERFDLAAYAKKKVATLSKGMSQKLQILLSVLHDPDLLIFDEPFSGLDPVNVRLVRQLVQEHRDRGKLVCLCTHMMAEVQALCDRVMMMHRGARVLYGPLDEIRRAHTDYQVTVDIDAAPEGLPSVDHVACVEKSKNVYLKDGKTIADFMRDMSAAGRSVRFMSEGLRSIEDVFVSVVGRQDVVSAEAPK
ncbi:MAG: ATP-binding cassette domain-containing protein [Phycisphaerales bacterium]|nr:ATP-binding cassette domain-containing protein [Phycisphaerales bacterium]MCB9854733.1 ATP-binding cassette domain-containing protein [Phycisphaerales bacterium]